MVKVNRINISQVEGGYSDDSDKRPNGEMALYDDDNGGFDLVIHDGVNSTNLNKVLGKGKFYGHNADSADGNGYDTIKLIPDIEAYNNGSNQYLIIDPTAPNHIHIRAGGTQDNSNSQLFLGGENSFVSVYTGENPPIYIRANNYNWTFNVDGSFMLPTSGNITFGDETVQNTAASGLISEAFNTSLVAGSGISLDYDSITETLTISSSGTVSGSGVSDILAGSYIDVSSVSGVYTISGTGEAARVQTSVFNKTGSQIPKFSVVYINGGQGDQPTVALAVASGEMTSSKTYGITAENIDHMSAGLVTVIGALTGLDTDQFNPTAPTGDVNGVTLWLSPTTPGGVTTTKPTGPYHAVAVGTIVRTHQNEGVVEVRVQNGYELDELHNVFVSGVIDGQFLQYNSGSGLWIPSSSGSFTILNVDNLRLDGNTISSTNASGNIIIQPNASGALQRDSGGDTRGAYAVDWQTDRFENNQVASGMNSVIGGGNYNRAAGQGNVIGGGNGNYTNGLESVIAGGTTNEVTGDYSSVCGGDRNSVSGDYTFVGGGSLNASSGDYSCIVGGQFNNDGGYDNVFILGSNITATQNDTTYVQNIVGSGYGKFAQLHPTVVSNGTVSGNVATNVSDGQIFDMTLSGSTTLSNPTNAVDGVTIRWRITQDGTGGHTVALGSEFQIPSSATSPLPWSTAAGATDILAATYHAGRTKWDVVAFVPGY